VLNLGFRHNCVNTLIGIENFYRKEFQMHFCPRLLIIAALLLIPFAARSNVPHPRANPLVVEAVEEEVGLAPEATANLQKEFTLEGFFAGHTVARGSIFSKIAGAARSFRASTKGTWDGKVLTLVETYQYAATSREERVWKFTKTGRNTYLAESDEILEKTDVVIDGRVATFEYKKEISRPGKKKPVTVTFKETWTLQRNGVLESRTELKKLVRVGREAVNFVRVGNEAALSAP